VAIGNVATDLYVQGTSEQIERAVREAIDLCAKDSAFILSSGCEIPCNSTRDRVLYFVEFGRDCDKYKKP
jgi:uroporphyrinogen-III decarboxylase